MTRNQRSHYKAKQTVPSKISQCTLCNTMKKAKARAAIAKEKATVSRANAFRVGKMDTLLLNATARAKVKADLAEAKEKEECATFRAQASGGHHGKIMSPHGDLKPRAPHRDIRPVSCCMSFTQEKHMIPMKKATTKNTPQQNNTTTHNTFDARNDDTDTDTPAPPPPDKSCAERATTTIRRKRLCMPDQCASLPA